MASDDRIDSGSEPLHGLDRSAHAPLAAAIPARAASPLKSEAYRRDYDEVKTLGSLTGSTRSAEQTDLARFWSNIPGQMIGAVRAISDAHLTDVGDSARLFALVTLAAADSQITVYDTKYRLQLLAA